MRTGQPTQPDGGDLPSALAARIARDAEHAGLAPTGTGPVALEWTDPQLPGLSVRFSADTRAMILRLPGARLAVDGEIDAGALDGVQTPLITVDAEPRLDGLLPVLTATVPISESDDSSPIPLVRAALRHARTRLLRATREHTTRDGVRECLADNVPEDLPDPAEGEAFDRALAALTVPDLPPGTPQELIDSLRAWSDAGLGAPFLPDRFAPLVHPQGEWAWGWTSGSGSDEQSAHPVDAYRLMPEVRRFTAGDWRPRYHLSHAGHGANSYSINYVIVTERLAVFAQAPWGGAYMKPDRAATDVLDLAGGMSQVFAFAEAIREWPDGRLVVVHSSFRRSLAPAWVGRPGDEPTPTDASSAPASRVPRATGTELGLPGALRYLHGLWLAERGSGEAR